MAAENTDRQHEPHGTDGHASDGASRKGEGRRNGRPSCGREVGRRTPVAGGSACRRPVTHRHYAQGAFRACCAGQPKRFRVAKAWPEKGEGRRNGRPSCGREVGKRTSVAGGSACRRPVTHRHYAQGAFRACCAGQPKRFRVAKAWPEKGEGRRNGRPSCGREVGRRTSVAGGHCLSASRYPSPLCAGRVSGVLRHAANRVSPQRRFVASRGPSRVGVWR